MAPPLPRASLQISLPPAPLRVCIPLLVVVFIFYKWSLKCPGLDLGDDDMLNDGNDGSAPLAECVDGTAPLLPSASAGTSGEGGAADASEAAAANGLNERLRTTVPMFQAAGRVSVDMLKNGLVHYGDVRFRDASVRKRL